MSKDDKWVLVESVPESEGLTFLKAPDGSKYPLNDPVKIDMALRQINDYSLTQYNSSESYRVKCSELQTKLTLAQSQNRTLTHENGSLNTQVEGLRNAINSNRSSAEEDEGSTHEITWLSTFSSLSHAFIALCALIVVLGFYNYQDIVKTYRGDCKPTIVAVPTN